MGAGAIKTTGTATLSTISNTDATIKNLTIATSGSFNYAPIPNFSANTTYYPWFSQNGTNIGKPGYHTGLSYNPSTGTLTTTTFAGTLSGNASSAAKFNENKKITISGAVSGNASSDFASSDAMTISVSYAGTVPINKGGTNITSYTKGDILYANNATTPALVKLAAPTTQNAILVGRADNSSYAPAWRTNVTLSTQVLAVGSTTQLTVNKNTDTTATNDGNAAMTVAGGISVGKTVAAAEYKIADHVTLHYDSATESLNFIFN